jgi:outer membrane cobalamin receptor
LNVLPDVLLDFHLQEKKIIITGGWVGEVRKNTYQYLVSQNPWINQPLSQFNTRTTEAYGGVKGTLENSFNYRIVAGYAEYLYLPLFTNHVKGSLFQVINETKLQAVHTQAELGFVLQNKLNASAKLDIYSFLLQQNELLPWHILPIQLTTAVRWQPMKKIMVKADLYAWQGANYKKDIAGNTGRLTSVFDLNAGAEFQVHKNFSVWGQFNNILNNPYQRWNNYDVVGFNFLAGIRLTFDQKLK